MHYFDWTGSIVKAVMAVMLKNRGDGAQPGFLHQACTSGRAASEPPSLVQFSLVFSDPPDHNGAAFAA
jgi:hypothetical protein